MGLSLLIDEKYRRMLLSSEFMKQPELKQYRDCLVAGISLEEAPEDVREAFALHHNDWIRNSMGEWRRAQPKYELTIRYDYKGEKQTCELCDHVLTSNVYHVFNKVNGHSLYIGSTCLDHVLNKESGVNGRVLSIAQAKRQDDFKAQFPDVYALLSDRPSDAAAYEVSDQIIHEETALVTSVRGVLRRFVDGNRDYGDVHRLRNQLVALKAHIRQDMVGKNDQNSLSRQFREQIKMDQSSQFNSIRRSAQANGGYLTTETAALIKVTQFLQQYLDRLNHLNQPQTTGIQAIASPKQGVFQITLHNQLGSLTYSFNSKLVIGAFQYPLNNVTHEKAQQLLTSGGHVVKKLSQSQMLAMGMAALEARGFESSVVEVDEFRAYVRQAERRITDSKERTNVTVGRFNQINKQQLLFSFRDQFVMHTPAEVAAHGQGVFEAAFLGLDRPALRTTLLSRADVLEKLRQAYDAKYSKDDFKRR